MADLTRILQEARAGDSGASARLASLLYNELRAMARAAMVRERTDHTLQPTALVHEAYLRLLDGEVDVLETAENRTHFFGAAAQAIRRVLVDHARKRGRLKRGGDRDRVPLEFILPVLGVQDDEMVLALDEALQRLADLSPRKARIVELRFFAGMTIPEVARMLEISEPTVEREWRFARAWLRGELKEHNGS